MNKHPTPIELRKIREKYYNENKKPLKTQSNIFKKIFNSFFPK